MDKWGRRRNYELALEVINLIYLLENHLEILNKPWDF